MSVIHAVFGIRTIKWFTYTWIHWGSDLKILFFRLETRESWLWRWWCQPPGRGRSPRRTSRERERSWAWERSWTRYLSLFFFLGIQCRFLKLLLHLFQVIMNTLRVSETLSHLTVLLKSPQSSVPTWFITTMTAARSRCTLWMKSFWKNISNDRCEYYSLVGSVWICTLGSSRYLWPFHF